MISAAAPSGTVVLQGFSITGRALDCECLLSSTSDFHHFYPLQPAGINIYARLLQTCLKKASGLNYAADADRSYPRWSTGSRSGEGIRRPAPHLSDPEVAAVSCPPGSGQRSNDFALGSPQTEASVGYTGSFFFLRNGGDVHGNTILF